MNKLSKQTNWNLQAVYPLNPRINPQAFQMASRKNKKRIGFLACSTCFLADMGVSNKLPLFWLLGLG